MSASPLWELSDSLFFAALLFVSFALLTGLTFSVAESWKTNVLRALTYGGAGLACLLQTLPFAPGYYFDFREVPLALAAGLMAPPWSFLIAAGLGLYRWLVLGAAGAGAATVQLTLVVVTALLLRRAGLNIGFGTRKDAVFAALVFLPGSAVAVLKFLEAQQSLASALELYTLKVIFSVVFFCVWSAVASLTTQNILSTQRYRRLATRDALTGLHNRYAFEEDQTPPAADRFLLLLDLDHFKRVNDQHGHLYGDQVLQEAGQVLSRHAERARGRAYRVGGEEFAVRVRLDAAEAERFAESLRLDLSRQLTERFGRPDAPLTISGGLVADGPDAFGAADDLLYAAKAAGRDQVVVAWRPRPPELPASPFNEASPGTETIRSLLRFLAEQGSDAPDLRGLLSAAILCVPGAEAGSLAVREGPDSVVRAQVGYGEALLGKRYSLAHMHGWHGDVEGWRQGRPRILVGQMLRERSLANNDEPADVLDRVSRRLELQTNLLLPIVVGGEVVAELNLDNLHRTDAFGATSLALAQEFGLWAAAVLATYERRRREQQTQEGALMVLGAALEGREGETQGHTRRVVHLASVLGEQLGLTPTEQLALRQGGHLHDLGKLQLPDRVLLKAGPLDAEETALMRSHVQLGAELASHFPTVLPPARDVILYHHECWDGRGYPHGLSGEAIPLLARIFAVADVYDTLVSDRPYRPAWSAAQAQEHLIAQRGRQFDPAVVDAFAEVMGFAAYTSGQPT